MDLTTDFDTKTVKLHSNTVGWPN